MEHRKLLAIAGIGLMLLISPTMAEPPTPVLIGAALAALALTLAYGLRGREKAAAPVFMLRGRTMTHVRPRLLVPTMAVLGCLLGFPTTSQAAFMFTSVSYDHHPCDFQWVFQWNVEEPNVVEVFRPLPVAQQTDWLVSIQFRPVFAVPPTLLFLDIGRQVDDSLRHSAATPGDKCHPQDDPKGARFEASIPIKNLLQATDPVSLIAPTERDHLSTPTQHFDFYSLTYFGPNVPNQGNPITFTLTGVHSVNPIQNRPYSFPSPRQS
jgi:hypothetical protein